MSRLTATTTTLVLLFTSGCFAPVALLDCRQSGACECRSEADCAAGLACIDGRCGLLPDAGPPDELGVSCLDGAGCLSGLCLPRGPGNGRVCTVGCDRSVSCPRRWECKAFGDGGLCVPPFEALCLPCQTDSDCNAAGDRCVGVGGERRCGKDCSQVACPSGYTCAGLDGGTPQCVPTGGTCECAPASTGLSRSCSRKNAKGHCFGREVCQGDQTWSSCDAREPADETCNGVDDDCDGLFDQTDPSMASPFPDPRCTKGDAGVCTGAWECRDGGFSCSAADPVPERCNGRDDDCNARVDETFLDPSGRYLDPHHCGACGYDCDRAIPHALDGGTACELRSGAPTCLARRCAPGFAGYPEHDPLTCRALVTSSCRPCSTAADCSWISDRCVSVGTDQGRFCAQSCDVASVFGCQGLLGQQDCCPSGYRCQLSAGDKLCLPESQSCTCSPSRAGQTRSCLTGAPPQSCVGLETCQSSGAWSACSTQSTTRELCDTLDNDCDGKVDEDFVGTRDSGTYDTDEHCGACARNCLAMWSPALQHAVGGCDAGPGRAPSCAIARCTQEAVAAGEACRLDSECPSGERCDVVLHQCVKSCQSSGDCGGAPCWGGRCATACGATAACRQRFGAAAFCGDAGACAFEYQFVNTDRDSTNGCECATRPGAVDGPELFAGFPDAGAPYLDQNCDGVDGDEASSLFVWAGSSRSRGTRQEPFRTIGEALGAFRPGTHAAILVAQGSYVEQVTLRAGVAVFGGYAPGFERRDVAAFPSVLEGPEPDWTSPQARRGTVHAEGISTPTVLAGFTIRGYDVTFRPSGGGAGKNSYAVYAKNSTSALTLANNRIIGGRGGEGAPGFAGIAGASGASGGDGLDSKECVTARCQGESQAGGQGGVNVSCAQAAGNVGAASSGSRTRQAYQPPLGLNGEGGDNNTYQHSDPSQAALCKYDCIIGGQANGMPGRDGPDGTFTRGGNGCVGVGVVTADEWVTGSGGSGSDGAPGVGAGGGGAGGCVVNSNAAGCTVGQRLGDLGATGGGGGAGGCGGTPGLGGGGGGASFAVYVVGQSQNLPRIVGNFIEVGAGGAGGNGGPGGYGGQGGQGGRGGIARLPAWCAGSAGKGGRGGNGGAGSGGGGGCGGGAFGIAGSSLAGSGYAAANLFGAAPASAAGAGGRGGASPAGSAAFGGDGVSGAVSPYQEF